MEQLLSSQVKFVKRTGGGVNGVIEFDLNIALSSAFEITDPEIA